MNGGIWHIYIYRIEKKRETFGGNLLSSSQPDFAFSSSQRKIVLFLHFISDNKRWRQQLQTKISEKKGKRRKKLEIGFNLKDFVALPNWFWANKGKEKIIFLGGFSKLFRFSSSMVDFCSPTQPPLSFGHPFHWGSGWGLNQDGLWMKKGSEKVFSSLFLDNKQ